MRILTTFFSVVFLFTSCSSMFATRKSFNRLTKEVEAVEEELEEAELSAAKRKKLLKTQIKDIKDIKAERTIFEKAMQRISGSLLQDMDEIRKSANNLSVEVFRLKKESDAIILKYKIARKNFEITWLKNMNSIKKLICPSFKSKFDFCKNLLTDSNVKTKSRIK